MKLLSGKKVLITGGSGSIGSEIVRQVLKNDPDVVRIFSRDETRQFFLQEELKQFENVRFLIGDIRDENRIDTAMQGIDIVYHAAALKHVPSCEYNPFEAVKTNVTGTQNVIKAAIHNEVEKVIAISTDKAVNPVNVMGATKLLLERLVITAQFSSGKHITRFGCVRFGNVLGSRGSFLDLFYEQIKREKKVTITDPDMTRFYMCISDAAQLVFKATKLMKGGEIFIFKMPVARLGDVVDVAIEEIAPCFNYPVGEILRERIGIRPGEKKHEELMTYQESLRARDTKDMFIVIPEQVINLNNSNYRYPGEKPAKAVPFLSNNIPMMSKLEISDMIKKSNILIKSKSC